MTSLLAVNGKEHHFQNKPLGVWEEGNSYCRILRTQAKQNGRAMASTSRFLWITSQSDCLALTLLRHYFFVVFRTDLSPVKSPTKQKKQLQLRF
jgi:hypothetical protein